jgi:hypothetical protein
MTTRESLRSLLDTLISSAFDPNPIAFRETDERGTAPVRRACGKAPGVAHRLRAALNRNAFLCGSLDFTEHERIEHILLGFGQKFGQTTRVEQIAHVTGLPNEVRIPDSLQQAVVEHIHSDHRAEVLIFHNHPLNPANVLVDNTPLASGTDRETLLGYYLYPLIAIKSAMGGGRVRCYLGENGFVREFRTPNLLKLLERIPRRTQVNL